MFTEQLTRWGSPSFAESVFNQINKDYPAVAKVIKNNFRKYAVFVTKEYLEYCEKYVAEKCRIKDKVYNK